MPTSQITMSGDIAAIAMSSSVTRYADGHIGHEIQVPAAKLGTLTTRTNDTTGTLTMSVGHGFATGDKIDLYWETGRRMSVAVGNVSGNAVPISGGSGNSLPAVDTSVTAMKQVFIDTDFVGAKVEMIGALMTGRGRLAVLSASPINDELSVDLTGNEAWLWWKGYGNNPLATIDVDRLGVTQAGTGTVTFRFGVLYDSTP